MTHGEIREQNVKKVSKIILDSMISQGIAATTKESVAKAARLSLASVVRYFRTKDDMIFAALKAIDKEQVDCFGELHGTGAERLHQFFTILCERYLENPSLYILRAEVAVHARRSTSNLMTEFFNTMGYRQRFRQIVELGAKDGTIHSDLMEINGMDFYLNIIFAYMSDIALRNDITNPEEKEKARFIIERMLRLFEFELTGIDYSVKA